MTVVRDQLFPQKPPGSCFRFSRTGVQPSPGSSTIELPSAFAESDAYPPDRELLGSPRQCSLPLACRQSPEGHQIEARKRRTPENTILSQPYCRRVSTDRPNREGSQLAASLEGEPGPTTAGKTLSHLYLETRFRRERARDIAVWLQFSVLNLVFQYYCSGVNVERVRGPNTVSLRAAGPREFDLLTPAAQHDVLLCVISPSPTKCGICLGVVCTQMYTTYMHRLHACIHTCVEHNIVNAVE